MEEAKSKQDEPIIIEDSDDEVLVVSKASFVEYAPSIRKSAPSTSTAQSVTFSRECTPTEKLREATASAVPTKVTSAKCHVSILDSSSTPNSSRDQTPLRALPNTPVTTPQELAKSKWRFPSPDSSPSVRKGKGKQKDVIRAVDLTSDNEDEDDISHVPHYSILDDQVEISNDSPVTTIKRRSGANNSTTTTGGQTPETVGIEYIDLEAWEDEDFARRQNRSVLCVDDVYAEEALRRPSRRISTVLPPRNPPVTYPYECVEQVTHNGMNIRPDKVVELRDDEVHGDEDFLRIKTIVRHVITHKVTLRGVPLQRNRHLNGLLERKWNEVCERYEIDLDDPRKPEDQCIVEVALSQIVKIRKTITTNLLYPCGRDPEIYKDQATARLSGTLVVRWKYICKYASASHRQKNVWKERIVMRCTETESTCKVISDTELRLDWLETFKQMTYGDEEESKGCIFVHEDHDNEAPKVRRGSGRPVRAASVQVLKVGQKREQSLDGDENKSKKCKIFTDLRDTNRVMSRLSVEPVKTTSVICVELGSSGEIPPTGYFRSSGQAPRLQMPRGRKLTYGDAFCGAGGASRGADLAGLEVKWGFDIWEHACTTWNANFPHAQCYQMHCQQFVSEVTNGKIVSVDILHLSPPCQTWSPAHTVPGKNDEMNTASLFAVMAIIMAVRPKVVTLEQTFGICMARFQPYFNALVQQFTSLNFSVRWAILPLQNLGLPQRRHRLIIVAACPGETLPQMPEFTHSDGYDGLRPFVTVNEVLGKAKDYLRQTGQHDPVMDSVLNCDPPKPPYDGGKFLRRAITTHGGQNYHPNGFRDFTLREYALLQGFPPHHVFKGLGIKKQIGNAVPPSFAKALFRSIIKDLGGANDAALIRPVVVD